MFTPIAKSLLGPILIPEGGPLYNIEYSAIKTTDFDFTSASNRLPKESKEYRFAGMNPAEMNTIEGHPHQYNTSSVKDWTKEERERVHEVWRTTSIPSFRPEIDNSHAGCPHGSPIQISALTSISPIILRPAQWSLSKSRAILGTFHIRFRLSARFLLTPLHNNPNYKKDSRPQVRSLLLLPSLVYLLSR